MSCVYARSGAPAARGADPKHPHAYVLWPRPCPVSPTPFTQPPHIPLQSALARILLSDATDKVCAEQFIARGHDVDSKPGLSKDELKKIIHEYDGAFSIRSVFGGVFGSWRVHGGWLGGD